MAIQRLKNYQTFSDPNSQPQSGVGFDTVPTLKGKKSVMNFENGRGGYGSISGTGSGIARLSDPAAQQRIADQLAMNANPDFQARMDEQSKIVDDRIAARLANENSARQAAMLSQQQPIQQIAMPQLAGRSQEIQSMIDRANSAISNGSGLEKKNAMKMLDSIMGQEAQQQQNLTAQQGQVMDMQRAREQMQSQQQQNMAEQMARQSVSEAGHAFSRQQLKDKFGMDVALQQMKDQSKLAKLASAPKALTPYEKKSQQEQAKVDIERGAERDRYSKTLNMLDDKSEFGQNINNLISQSTGSAVGAGIDALGRSLGVTTSGAKAASELTPFANQLIMMMPRGPGAQSDRDVKIASDMAGAIADTTRTVEERQAAFKGLKDFYSTLATQYGYTEKQGQQPGQMTAPPRATQVKPAGVADSDWEEYLQATGG
jgi:hypothetical protein